MMRPTFSTLERTARCPGHLALPHVYSSGPAAERGTAIHDYLEAVQNGADPEEALELVPDEYRALCAAIDLDRLPKGLAAEVAFAYDFVTGKAREFGRGVKRKYEGLGPTEIAGTVDVLGVSEDAVYVGDYKTGWSELPAPAEAFQLRIGALAASRVYARERAVVEFVRIKENGGSWKVPAELDGFDLDAFAADLRPLKKRIEEQQALAATRGGVPDVSTGPWCKHCPAWAACPAQKAFIQRAVAAVNADESNLIKPTTAAEYGQAWHLAKAMASLARRLEKQVKEVGLPEFGELPLPGGRLLREVVEEGDRELEGRVVFAVVRDLYNEDLAGDVVEVSATFKRIGEALKRAPKEVIPARGAAKAERAILAEVEKRGGLTRPTVKRLREVDPAQAPAVEAAGSSSPAALPAPAPKEAANDPDAKDRANVAARLERVLEEKDPAGALQLIRHRIKLGMESDVESWAPLLKLWGLASEELKERKGAA